MTRPEPNPPEAAADAPAAPARYRFGAFARESWGWFRRAAGPLVAVFCVVHVIAAVLPYLMVFDIPDAVGYPLVFLFRVVVPVVLGTLAVAAGTVLMQDTDQAAVAPGAVDAVGSYDRVRGRLSEVLVLGLVASLIATAAVLLLGAYGFLILQLFYGPPVAIQVLMLEKSSYRDAMQRARELLRGNWRTVLYLLNASLLIGAVSLLILDLVVRALGGTDDVLLRPLLGVAQGLVLGTLTAFMAGAQMAVYRFVVGARDEPEIDRSSEDTDEGVSR